MSEDTQTKLAALIAERLKAYAEKSPEERFQSLVDRGYMDRHGNLTTLCGGDAQPEPKR